MHEYAHASSQSFTYFHFRLVLHKHIYPHRDIFMHLLTHMYACIFMRTPSIFTVTWQRYHVKIDMLPHSLKRTYVHSQSHTPVYMFTNLQAHKYKCWHYKAWTCSSVNSPRNTDMIIYSETELWSYTYSHFPMSTCIYAHTLTPIKYMYSHT